MSGLLNPPSERRCETCRYLRAGQHGWYECHRKEPQIAIKKECDDEAIQPVAMWPNVATSDWCGEYSSKKRGA